MSDNNQNNKGGVWALVITVGVLVLACGGGAADSGLFDGGDSSTTVETLSTSDGSALATKLAEAYDAQGICYGWRLRTGGSYVYSGTDDSDAGSNLGDGRALDTTSPPEECDKAVVLVASVTYTSSSSESDDYASVRVETHNVDLPYSVNSDLERFGVTDKTLIDDPVGAVARGALALPLLVAEYGLAEPLPRPSDSGTATAAPAPSVGSDFLRDRGWLLLAIVILLAFTAFAVVFGVRSRRRTDEEAAMAAAEAVRRTTRAAEARRRRAEQNAPTKPPTS